MQWRIQPPPPPRPPYPYTKLRAKKIASCVSHIVVNEPTMRVSECSSPMDRETAKVLLFLSGKICLGLLGEPSNLRSFSS